MTLFFILIPLNQIPFFNPKNHQCIVSRRNDFIFFSKSGICFRECRAAYQEGQGKTQEPNEFYFYLFCHNELPNRTMNTMDPKNNNSQKKGIVKTIKIK